MDFSMKFKYLPVYFMCLCGVISHALLLIAFAKDPLKCFRNSATYIVANLAVSDLTISFLWIYICQLWLSNKFSWSFIQYYRCDINVLNWSSVLKLAKKSSKTAYWTSLKTFSYFEKNKYWKKLKELVSMSSISYYFMVSIK